MGQTLRHSEELNNFGKEIEFTTKVEPNLNSGVVDIRSRLSNRAREGQNVSGYGSLSNIAVETESQGMYYCLLICRLLEPSFVSLTFL